MSLAVAAGIELDGVQRRVVEHDGGPLLVLGSPGTGKTTVLVERWLRLATTDVDPHRILLLLPTRDRALALRDELPFRLPQKAVLEIPVHTWHALAYHLITRYYRLLGYSQPPIRLTSATQLGAVYDLLLTEDREAWGAYQDHLLSDAFVAEVADFCVRAGHRGLNDDDLRSLAADRPEHASVANFALRYREHLREEAALDYAELVVAATRLLRENESVSETVRRRFSHVLVDDAQELAPAQLQLLRELNVEHLVCAGDPDSAIEAFRGADPAWLDRFETIAPEHERIVLDTCHRYGKSIGDVATSLIAHSPEVGLARRAGSFLGPEDGTTELRVYSTMAGELEGVAREIKSAHVVGGVPFERMAILLAQPSTYGFTVERVLRTFEIPCQGVSADGLRTQPAVRAVLDLCRLALLEERSDELCKAVMCSPMFGFHPYRVRELDREARMRRGTTLEALIDERSDEDILELRRVRDAARKDPNAPATDTFLSVLETSQWYADQVRSRRDDDEAAAHISAINALSRALSHFVERQPGATMLDYLETSADSAFAVDTWRSPDSDQGVRLMSFHGAKGQEWDVVCVIGVAEGQIPKAHRAQGLFDPWALERGGAIERAQAQLAEERRTLYVALTRSRRRLLVTTSPGVRKATPSRFCEEGFGVLPEPITPGADEPPLTLAEAASRHRRTLARTESTTDECAAATAALARIAQTAVLDPGTWWWRRDWTPGAELYPAGKLTTSYSRIGRYDECPLRYVLESVLGLDPQTTFQMKFGSLVHRIIERSDPAFGDIKDWKTVVDVYKKEFVERHRDDYPNDVFARTYYRYGVQSLKRWWTTERKSGETVGIEFSFDDLDFDGHTIRGRIDRVAKGAKGLVLSDYKTGRNAIAWRDAKDSLQLAIYYKAAQNYEELHKHGDPVLMQLIYPGIEQVDRQDGSVSCAKRRQYPNEADEALKRLNAILDDAVLEKFAPSPEADCRWCRMKPLCPRWPEGREVPR